MSRVGAIKGAIKAFDWHNYGLDEVDPNDKHAAWVPALTASIVAALGKPAKVKITRPNDEQLVVRVNGREVASANHDEHGWSGMDAVESTAVAIARACGATLVGSSGSSSGAAS